MSWTNDIVSKLIAKGKAQSGHFVGGLGAVSRLNVPKGHSIIVTRIELQAFADLPAGQGFSDTQMVIHYTWHQLNVWTDRGEQVFNTRHKLMSAINGGQFILPIGSTVWDTWINATDAVWFSLSHAPALAGWTLSNALVPSDQLLPDPPLNYGNEPTGIPFTRAVRWSAGTFAGRPLGLITPPLAGATNPYNQVQWQIERGLTDLNPGQPGITFGELTFPVLNVDYILIKGTPDDTFQGVL